MKTIRLIDARRGLHQQCESLFRDKKVADQIYWYLCDGLEECDAVEVVRCEDCKYAKVADTEDSQDGYTCQFHRGSIWFSGSYCSWAERKEE